jgi:hypothetical protein
MNSSSFMESTYQYLMCAKETVKKNPFFIEIVELVVVERRASMFTR